MSVLLPSINIFRLISEIKVLNKKLNEIINKNNTSVQIEEEIKIKTKALNDDVDKVAKLVTVILIFTALIFCLLGIYTISQILYGEDVMSRTLVFLFDKSFTQIGTLIWALLTFTIGYLLFRFKKKQQFFYGLLETLFAIFNCYLVIETTQKSFINNSANIYYTASIMTSIYLTVRGLSNMDEGYNKSKDVLNIIKDVIVEVINWYVKLMLNYYY